MTELLLMLCLGAAWYYCVIFKYKQSSYFNVTKQLYFKMLFDIGLHGEYLTYKYLKTYENKGMKFLFNCYIPKNDGETTEADVLLIGQSGIYVFESENYSGWIFGSENSRMWTQTLPQGRDRKAHKEQFLNPIYQNKLHIQCLSEILHKKVPMHSIIVFSERCKFKNLDIHNDSAEVIHRNEVGHIVNKIHLKYGNILTEDEIDTIYKQLYPYTQVSEQVKQEHIRAIEKHQTGTNNNLNKTEDRRGGQKPVLKEQNGNIIAFSELVTKGEVKEETVESHQMSICPKCGGKMVLRTAKKGANQGRQFYGCSNYPKCRYIRNIDEDKNKI